MGNIKQVQAIFDHMGVGVIVADRDARIISVNPRAAAMVDRPLGGLLNRPVVSLVTEDDRGKTIAALKQLVSEPQEDRIRQKISCGVRKFYAVITLLKIDDDPAGWIIILEDAYR
jgi:PAS domain S-box-containing protein